MLPGLLTGQTNSEAIVELQIEKAADPSGPWEVIPPDSLQTTSNDGMLDVVAESQAFYRLLIAREDESFATLGIPLSKVPPEVRELAEEFLISLVNEEPDWKEAVLAPVVIPVHNPAVEEGKMPAFYEFKVVGLSPQPEPPDQPGFGTYAPVTPIADLGFILVTHGRHDVPIPQYSTSGPTRCEQLLFRAQGKATRLMRYDSGFWVAEDDKGSLKASLGSTPYQMTVDILDWMGKLETTRVFKNELQEESPNPPVKPLAYTNYEAFKDDYVGGPVYTRLHKLKAKRAELDWAPVDDVEPPNIKIPVMEDTLILQDIEVASFELEDELVPGWIEPKGGLWVTSSLDTSTMLTVIDTAGEVYYYILIIGNPIDQLGSWSSWTSYYALSACGWIPHYYQVRNLSGCCTDGASGCGPTAWAMFYGFWDMRTAPHLIGGTGTTPYSVDADVEHCIQRTFDLTGCWCTGINSQAATTPWGMDDGYAYAAERDESITMTSTWCVPYTSSSPRRLGQNAIRWDDRPIIVGTGYFAHYPMAYAYRYRKYRAWGITWKTQYQWKVFQGWYGINDCEWVSANSCWFALNGYCD